MSFINNNLLQMPANLNGLSNIRPYKLYFSPFQITRVFSIIIIILLFPFTSHQSLAQIVHRLIADRFTHYRIDDWISYAPSLYINSIDIDEDYIYFATKSGGILRYHKYRDFWDYPYTTSSGLRSNNISQIVYSDEDGFLYAQTPMGIDVYKRAENYWQPSDISRLPASRRPRAEELTGLSKKKDFRFPPFFRPKNDYLPDFFTDIFLTYHLDGRIFDQYNREFLFTDRITDSWQRLWIGTTGFGPMKADLFNFNLESHLQSIPDISPRDIYIDQDYMWIAGERNSNSIGGITLWDRQRNEWNYFEAQFIPQLYKDDVFAISGNNRFVFFATILGISIFDQDKRRWKSLNTQDGLRGNKVLDVVAANGVAYIGTEYGFNWIDLPTMKIYELHETTLDNVAINQLALDDSIVWAATRFGLYNINIKNYEAKFMPTRAAISDWDLTAIEIIEKDIWVASENGIAYWDRRSNEWHSFADLRIRAKFRDICATEKAVWFASNKGLLKFDRENNYWRLFTKDDGIVSNDIFHIDPEEDILWISTSKGVTSFRWKREGRFD